MEISFSDAEGGCSFICSVLYVSRKENVKKNTPPPQKKKPQTRKTTKTYHQKQPLLCPLQQ